MITKEEKILFSLFFVVLGFILRTADCCLLAYANSRSEISFIDQIFREFRDLIDVGSSNVNADFLRDYWLKLSLEQLKSEGRQDERNISMQKLLKEEIARAAITANSSRAALNIVGFIMQQLAGLYAGTFLRGYVGEKTFLGTDDYGYVGGYLATFASDPLIVNASTKKFLKLIEKAETVRKPETGEDNLRTTKGKEVAESSTMSPSEGKKGSEFSRKAKEIVDEYITLSGKLQEILPDYKQVSIRWLFEPNTKVKELFGPDNKERYNKFCAFFGEMLYGDVKPREGKPETTTLGLVKRVTPYLDPSYSNITTILSFLETPGQPSFPFKEGQSLHVIREHLQDNKIRLRFVKKVGNDYFFADGTQAKVAEDDIL